MLARTRKTGPVVDWRAELDALAARFPYTHESCLENAQDMGFEPWSEDEAREVLRQLRNLADAGEAR